MIALEKLNTILFLLLRSTKNVRMLPSFLSIEFDENFFNVYFFAMPTCVLFC
jgi:hypothetical protein